MDSCSLGARGAGGCDDVVVLFFLGEGEEERRGVVGRGRWLRRVWGISVGSGMRDGLLKL